MSSGTYASCYFSSRCLTMTRQTPIGAKWIINDNRFIPRHRAPVKLIQGSTLTGQSDHHPGAVIGNGALNAKAGRLESTKRFLAQSRIEQSVLYCFRCHPELVHFAGWWKYHSEYKSSGRMQQWPSAYRYIRCSVFTSLKWCPWTIKTRYPDLGLKRPTGT